MTASTKPASGPAIQQPEYPAQILDEHGRLVRADVDVDSIPVLDLFRAMVRTRTFDARAMHLQRTGRIPYYYSCAGQEAHAAISFALEARDWIFIAYREQGVRLARGVTEREELALFAGKGYAGWDPTKVRISPVNATIGTHLPHATGYAYGSRLLGRDEISMAIFGDGATSEVDFHAGLNFAGTWKTPTIFYCQNNQYAQSTPLAQQTAARTLADKAVAYGMHGVRIDGMDVLAVFDAVRAAAIRAREGKGPTLIEAVCYRYQPHSTYDGTPVYRTREEEEKWQEKDPLIRMRVFLESRDMLPTGMEADIRRETENAVEEALDELDGISPPTRKSVFLSLQSSLTDRLREQLHEEERATGEPASVVDSSERMVIDSEFEPTGATRAMTLVEAINAELDDAMARDDRLLIMGEDVGREGGVFRVTDGLYEKHGADRMLDTPLCELGIVGTAIGMAIAGLRPLCEIEFAGFTLTAFDQIAFHVARYHWRSNGSLNLPIVIRMPCGGGHQGLEGHSDSPEALFTHVPGLIVIYPSNPRDAKGLLASALASDHPVVFFEPIAQYFVRQQEVPVESYTIPLGKARIAHPGSDVSLVTYGNTVHTACEVAKQFATEGVSVDVIDLRTLKPWDEACVLESVTRTGRLVVVHEANRSNGVGAEIVATVVEKAGDQLETPPARVTHADLVWAPAQLEALSMITNTRIAAAIRDVLED